MSQRATSAGRGPRGGAILLPVIVFAFGTAVCLVWGRVGFMPLDQSIVFDGAWRLVSGQVPFRDFGLPYGLTPIVIQALVFRALGVSWLAYCLHAAVFNGLFCVVVWFLLRGLGGSRVASAFFAAASGVMFYPAFGTPFPDQHAFFFTLVAIALATTAATHGTRGRPHLVGWALVPVALAAALLSKPVPSVFGLPIVLLPWLIVDRHRLRAAAAVLGGSAAAGVTFVAAAWSWGVSPAAVVGDLVAPVLTTGRSRLGDLAGRPGAAAGVAGDVAGAFLRPSFVLAAAGAVAVAAWAVSRRRRGVRAASGVLIATLALALLSVGPLFAAVTWNDPDNARGYVPAALGLAWVGLRRRGNAEDPGPLAHRPGMAAALAVVVFGAAFFDVARFHADVVVPRKVHSSILVHVPAPDPEVLPESLRFMRWHPIKLTRCTGKDFGDLAGFLASAEGGSFLLIGDSSILYGVTGRPSVNPALWFHPGLTVPWPSDPAFIAYQEELLARMRAARVRFVVVEGERTWLGFRPRHFRHLMSRLGRIEHRARFGPFEVLEVSAPADDVAGFDAYNEGVGTSRSRLASR